MMRPDPKMRPEVQRDWWFAEPFEKESLKFLRDHLFDKFCRDSSPHEDMKRGTDYVIDGPGSMRAAMRVRRIDSTRGKRDLTIRYDRPSRVKSEYEKMQADPVDYYCYCWVEGSHLVECIIVNFKAFASSKLYGEFEGPKSNKDGSSRFVFWTADTLQKHGFVEFGIAKPGSQIEHHYVTDLHLKEGPTGVDGVQCGGCGSKVVTRHLIHDGESVRIDCHKCGRFIDFAVWCDRLAAANLMRS